MDKNTPLRAKISKMSGAKVEINLFRVKIPKVGCQVENYQFRAKSRKQGVQAENPLYPVCGENSKNGEGCLD